MRLDDADFAERRAVLTNGLAIGFAIGRAILSLILYTLPVRLSCAGLLP